jgi:hypothetical protein
MLIPRELDPVAAGAALPLPPERPKVQSNEEAASDKPSPRVHAADEDDEPRPRRRRPRR